MALRELLLPWDAQPQEFASVDWTNPIALGLRLLVLPAFAVPVDATGLHGLSRTGSLPVRATAKGLAALVNASNTISVADNDADLFGSNISVFVLQHQITAPTSGSNTAFINAKTTSFNDTAGWHFQIDNSSLAFISGGSSFLTTAAPTSLGVHSYGATFAAGATRLFFDGAFRTSGTLTSTITEPTTALRIGDSVWKADLDNEILLVAVWNRTISDSEQIALHLDPWQLFEPRRIAVPVSAGGGATNLTVAEASHGHAADSLTLSIGVSLAINDATHAHAADSLTLSTAATLAVADATHAHAADQVTLTLAGSESLTIADATHAHAADVAGLTLDSLLAVADALHAHSADNVVLGVSGVADLVIADATHAHSVDGLVLTAQSLLAIQDALHAHAADALTLDTAPTLLIAEALHAHTSDGLALTVDAWLVIADALHGHTADSITLGDSGAVVLVVADAVHAHAADTLRLFYEVWAATKAPIGARHASGARAARLSTTARQPRLSTRTR